MTTRKILIIAGPTASGKSALAMDIAEAFSGVVVNGDSMQIYKELPVLTACPTAADMARVPHRLYGALSGREACSAARWLDLAVAEIKAVWAEGRLPIVTGGTGLYLKALMEGLSPIPEIPEAVRAEARSKFKEMGNEAFHVALLRQDPEMGARLLPSDSQRLMRAWEVFAATGKSLAVWQVEDAVPPLDAQILPLVLLPPRQVLHANGEARFDQMMARGALEEVRALIAMDLDPALPVMKALGVPELAAHLRGALSLDQAVTDAKTATRRYIKRQSTWLRNQMAIADQFSAQYSESLQEKIFAKIRQYLLTDGK